MTGLSIILCPYFHNRINKWQFCRPLHLCYFPVLHLCSVNKRFISLNMDISLPEARGAFREGLAVADTTGGSAMGYTIMKYTLRSRGASPHLSWGSQISQVTKPSPCLTRLLQPNHQLSFTQTLQPCAGPTLLVCWSDSSLNLSCHFALLTLQRHTAQRDKISFLVPCRKKKKKRKIFRKWKL